MGGGGSEEDWESERKRRIASATESVKKLMKVLYLGEQRSPPYLKKPRVKKPLALLGKSLSRWENELKLRFNRRNPLSNDNHRLKKKKVRKNSDSEKQKTVIFSGKFVGKIDPQRRRRGWDRLNEQIRVEPGGKSLTGTTTKTVPASC